MAYLWYVTGQSLWIFGFILELLSGDTQGKIFWDGAQWIASLLILLAKPIFAIQYTEYKANNPQRLFILSIIVPILFTFGLMADSLHHLIYRNPTLIPAIPFSELHYDFTWFVYGYALYSYLITFWAITILIRCITRIHDLYRTQLIIISIGFLIPIIGTILTLPGIQIAPQRDAIPFTAAAANLIIAWGLFRYHIFQGPCWTRSPLRSYGRPGCHTR